MMPKNASTLITKYTIVTVISEQVSCEIDGESVILNLANGHYFGLDPVGTRIWELLQQPRSIGEICDLLLSEYEVGSDECTQQVLAFLHNLTMHGLVKVVDGHAA